MSVSIACDAHYHHSCINNHHEPSRSRSFARATWSSDMPVFAATCATEPSRLVKFMCTLSVYTTVVLLGYSQPRTHCGAKKSQ